jgi:thymidylate synthase ThyX
MIAASVVADSASKAGKRITTLSLVYPRFIHAEFMTHRIFSRNAASSRAIPVKRFLEEIKTNPAMPIYWGKNQKGMQAEEELDPERQKLAKETILQLRDISVLFVEKLAELDLHKQTANRYLEPWQHMSTVVTSTEWDNAKNLRIHPKAQPEFKALMEAIQDQLENHAPEVLEYGKWHLPFVQDFEKHFVKEVHELIKYSVARCARVSYKMQDGEIDADKDAIRYWDLLSSGHMSPFEHQASPARIPHMRSGNFSGWYQYRKFIPGEEVFKDDDASIRTRQEFANRPIRIES